MTNLILAALMQVSALGAEQEDFNQAYQRSLQTKRPLVVLIGAVWCPACQKMSGSILPQVAQAGGLNRVVFIYLDYDQNRQLASRLSRTRSIPQLIRFDYTPNGWKGKLLLGARSPGEVYNFINAGLIEESKMSKASVMNRAQNAPREPAPGASPHARETAAKVSVYSSTHVARDRKSK